MEDGVAQAGVRTVACEVVRGASAWSAYRKAVLEAPLDYSSTLGIILHKTLG